MFVFTGRMFKFKNGISCRTKFVKSGLDIIQLKGFNTHQTARPGQDVMSRWDVVIWRNINSILSRIL